LRQIASTAQRGHRRERDAVGVPLEPLLDRQLHVGEIAGECCPVERLDRDRLQPEVVRPVVHLEVLTTEHVGHEEGMRILPADVVRVVERRRAVDPGQEHHPAAADVRLEDVAVAIAADLEEPVRVAHEDGRFANQRKPHRTGWGSVPFVLPAPGQQCVNHRRRPWTGDAWRRGVGLGRR
jgi:hypothetical protein